jgi:hypothetical protein
MYLFNQIDAFFAKDFKRRFIPIIAIPLIISIVFLVDFFLLSERNETDSIVYTQAITLSKSAGGTSAQTSHIAGYKYSTFNNYSFLTSRRTPFKSNKIELTISPIFKTVKSVEMDNKKIKIASGFSGINAVLLILCNTVIIISMLYTLATKKFTEHRRHNLIFVNVFLLLIWAFVLIAF